MYRRSVAIHFVQVSDNLWMPQQRKKNCWSCEANQHSEHFHKEGKLGSARACFINSNGNRGHSSLVDNPYEVGLPS